mmetsp:Transcript_62737/g.127831  ORF Transcript_62737/g.127831 Transcript_62737/m.127831 type:complete len:228 (+) Transcript_62737:1528-2211(+)
MRFTESVRATLLVLSKIAVLARLVTVDSVDRTSTDGSPPTILVSMVAVPGETRSSGALLLLLMSGVAAALAAKLSAPPPPTVAVRKAAATSRLVHPSRLLLVLEALLSSLFLLLLLLLLGSCMVLSLVLSSPPSPFCWWSKKKFLRLVRASGDQGPKGIIGCVLDALVEASPTTGFALFMLALVGWARFSTNPADGATKTDATRDATSATFRNTGDLPPRRLLPGFS